MPDAATGPAQKRSKSSAVNPPQAKLDTAEIAIPGVASAQGWRLPVRLTPRAARDEVGGTQQAADGETFVIIVRVRAVPEKGKANAALAALIATWLGLPKSSLRVAAGSKSRQKILEIEGDPADIRSRLQLALNARL